MTSVKIIGAGSIGNHLAHGSRQLGWAVTMTDVDPKALERTRTDIYPSRYGAWDEAIRLALPDQMAGESFDVVVVGTPPDTHIDLALGEIEQASPAIVLIEKPLCPPDLGACQTLRAAAAEAGVRVLVGYNHRLTRHTQLAAQWLKEGRIGEITTIRAMTREHWGGIFAAHPWLAGPADSYLGFTARGGGALLEHSHALNIWQYFSGIVGAGRIAEVSCMLDEVERDGASYDRIAQLSVRTEHGLVGTIVQDVVTRPAYKWARVEGVDGYLEWQVSVDPDHDLARCVCHDGSEQEERIAKTRPDDFRGELEHVRQLLQDPAMSSPIDLEPGLETMQVIVAALHAARSGRLVPVGS